MKSIASLCFIFLCVLKAGGSAHVPSHDDPGTLGEVARSSTWLALISLSSPPFYLSLIKRIFLRCDLRVILQFFLVVRGISTPCRVR